MEKINCNVIQDILPLYIDDVVSDDTKELVEEHLQNCEICQRVYHETKADLENDMKISAQTKESSNILTILLLLNRYKEKKDKNNPAFHSSNRNLLCGSVHVHE